MATRRWSQPVKMVVRHVFTGKTTPESGSQNRWNKHVTRGTVTAAAVLGGTLVAAGCYYQSQSRSDQGSFGGWKVQASSSSAKKRVLDPIAGASVLAKLSARERRFVQFASTEHNGQLYMTPQDFLESVIEAEPRPRLKRKALSEQDILRMHKSTPPLKKGSSRTFRDLRDHGIISYTEYLFLLSILTKPQTGFRIAFNMFDTDGNSRVDKEEFLVLLGILCQQMYKEETMRGVDPAILEKIFSHTYRGGVPVENATSASEKKDGDDQGLKVTSDKALRHGALAAAEGLYRRNNLDTTLLVLLFGKSGKHDITYENFSRFMENLQSEVLELEFLEFSKGLSTITELDFAKILLRYTQLSPHEYDTYLNRLLEGDYEERGITFAEFKDFCTFLNNLDDFAIAMRMYTLVDKPISQEEFQRAVKICTGTSLNPHLVQTVFLIFDEDGDNRLSDREFIAIMRDRVHRGLKSYAKTEGWDAFKHCVKHEMKSTL